MPEQSGKPVPSEFQVLVRTHRAILDALAAVTARRSEKPKANKKAKSPEQSGKPVPPEYQAFARSHRGVRASLKAATAMRSGKPNEAIWRAITSWTARRREWQIEFLPAIVKQLRRWHDRKLTDEAAQKEFTRWYKRTEGQKVASNAEALRLWVEDDWVVCRRLREFRIEAVEEVAKQWLLFVQIAEGNIKKIDRLERRVRDVYGRLTPRERVLCESLLYHRSRHDQDSYWDEIAKEFESAPTLAQKAVAPEDDADMAVLAQAYELSELPYGLHNPAEGTDADLERLVKFDLAIMESMKPEVAASI